MVAHGACGTVAVIGHGLHNHGHAAGAVTLVGDGLVIVAGAGAAGLLQHPLDVVVGHIGGLGLGDDRGQPGVVGRVGDAAPLLHRHNDLLGDFGEGRSPLGVLGALGFLNVMPLGMSGHENLPFYRYGAASSSPA